MVKLCQKDNSVVRHHRRHAQRHRPQGAGKGHAGTLLRRRHRRGTRRPLCRRHGDNGFSPRGVAIYSTFLQRAYDCIIHDVALQDLPVIFCMDRAGLSVNDGPTHHGLFDIAYLRCVPNIIAMAPKDEDELADMMFTATHQKHPAFIRYPRGPGEGVAMKEQPKLLEIGKAEVTRNFSGKGGRKAALFGLGNLHSMACKTADQLAAEGFDCAVINPRFTKPLDAGLTEFFGRAAEVVCHF
jgi:1-deoxy-D-xylulose-5-phosphate synthase